MRGMAISTIPCAERLFPGLLCKHYESFVVGSGLGVWRQFSQGSVNCCNLGVQVRLTNAGTVHHGLQLLRLSWHSALLDLGKCFGGMAAILKDSRVFGHQIRPLKSQLSTSHFAKQVIGLDLCSSIERRLQPDKQFSVNASTIGLSGLLNFCSQCVRHTQGVTGCLVSVCSHLPIVDVLENLYKESY